MMITMSLCMIVKNEEENIIKNLENIKDIFDEIIIVDTGSVDNSKYAARRFTDKVFDFKWSYSFSKARNFSFSQATQQYIFWLDADDFIQDEDRNKIINMKKNLDYNIDSVSMLYVNGIDENATPVFSFRRNRLIKRDRNYMWHGDIHEYIDVKGNILNSDIKIIHGGRCNKSKRNLDIYRFKINRGDKLTNRELFYYANELFDNGYYEQAIIYYKNVIKSGGPNEQIVYSCIRLSDCNYFKKNFNVAKAYCFMALKYGIESAEVLCRLGFYCLKEDKIKEAINWYYCAAKLTKHKQKWGFCYEPCWTWLPHLQLCVCYGKLDMYELACEHNEIAYKYRPSYDKILNNRQYFMNMGFLKQE